MEASVQQDCGSSQLNVLRLSMSSKFLGVFTDFESLEILNGHEQRVLI